MGKPVDQPGAVSLLEDAAHLLRRAPLDTLLCHWVGSAPFALGVLLFWNDQSHNNSDARCALGALLLALLLIWMSCWRAVYAGRIHRLLSGAADTPWNAQRVTALIANQAFLAGAKLLLLPLSLPAILPFATTVAFFRSATVFADRIDLDPVAVMAKARRLAGIDKYQCWMLQALILLLTFGAWVNVLIACIILPSLIRMLTGYESAFSRSGSSYFENRLFLLVTLGLTWLFFDPFVQAVYCLRCFHGSSVETGEDLRAGLRRIGASVAKGAVAAGLVLALLASQLHVARAADAVGAGDLQQAVRKALESPEYNWRFPPPEKAATDTPWIIQATERAIQAIEKAIQWLWDHFMRFLRWLLGGLDISPMPAGGNAPSAALHWSLWLLAVLVVAVAGVIIWRALSARRRKGAKPSGPSVAVVRLDDEGLTADRLPEESWLEMAGRAMAEGDLRLALRAFYLANLAWLGRQEFIRIHPGKTNREFEVELRRRTRPFPEAREMFSANIRAFERVWYGLHEAGMEDVQEFRRRSEEIKRILGAGLLDTSAGAAA